MRSFVDFVVLATILHITNSHYVNTKSDTNLSTLRSVCRSFGGQSFSYFLSSTLILMMMFLICLLIFACAFLIMANGLRSE